MNYTIIPFESACMRGFLYRRYGVGESLAVIIRETPNSNLKEMEVGLRHDMKELELSLKHDLTFRFGSMMAASIAIVAVLVKLL